MIERAIREDTSLIIKPYEINKDFIAYKYKADKKWIHDKNLKTIGYEMTIEKIFINGYNKNNEMIIRAGNTINKRKQKGIFSKTKIEKLKAVNYTYFRG